MGWVEKDNEDFRQKKKTKGLEEKDIYKVPVNTQLDLIKEMLGEIDRKQQLKIFTQGSSLRKSSATWLAHSNKSQHYLYHSIYNN